MPPTEERSKPLDKDPIAPETFRPELVVAFVFPLGSSFSHLPPGSSLPDIKNMTAGVLAKFGYHHCEEIKVTDYFKWLMPDKAKDLPDRSAASIPERYRRYMQAGDDLRQRAHEKGAAVLAVLRGLLDRRVTRTGNPTGLAPAKDTAYLVDSLKTPEEIALLRAIYGPHLVVIACYSPRPTRISNLAKLICTRTGREADANTDASELVQRDEEGEASHPYGQNVRDAFALADLIVRTDTSDPDFTEPRRAIKRFFQLLFQSHGKIHTPTRDEFGMFTAFAASLRSSSLSRQVGAAICSEDGQVIAVGTNEVAKAKGGAYWSDKAPERESDKRTFRLTPNPVNAIRHDLLASLFERLSQTGLAYAEHFKNIEQAVTAFETWQNQQEQAGFRTRTLLDGAIEYNREVHAELLALTDAARRGVSLQDQVLYTTTLPCHDCAKHLIAAGIGRVVYLDPYPKSLVKQLFPDSIHLEGDPEVEGDTRVRFGNFVGISPHRYASLFFAPLGYQTRHDGENVEALRLADFGQRYQVRPPSAMSLVMMFGEILLYQRLMTLLTPTPARSESLVHDGPEVAAESVASLPYCDYQGAPLGGRALAASTEGTRSATGTPEQARPVSADNRSRARQAVGQSDQNAKVIDVVRELWFVCDGLRGDERPKPHELGELLTRQLAARPGNRWRVAGRM